MVSKYGILTEIGLNPGKWSKTMGRIVMTSNSSGTVEFPPVHYSISFIPWLIEASTSKNNSSSSSSSPSHSASVNTPSAKSSSKSGKGSKGSKEKSSSHKDLSKSNSPASFFRKRLHFRNNFHLPRLSNSNSTPSSPPHSIPPTKHIKNDDHECSSRSESSVNTFLDGESSDFGSSPSPCKHPNKTSELLHILAFNALEFTAPIASNSLVINSNSSSCSCSSNTNTNSNSTSNSTNSPTSPVNSLTTPIITTTTTTATTNNTNSCSLELPPSSPPKNCSAFLSETLENRLRCSEEFSELLEQKSGLDLIRSLSNKENIILDATSRNFIQLSGHPGQIATAGPHTLWKKVDPGSNEMKIYEDISEYENDGIVQIVPKYFSTTKWNEDTFIEIQDLLIGFKREHLGMMDIKMGGRTFLQSEVKNMKLREDLYLKMIAVDENAPTEEEHKQRAVTKLRYMQFRELESSTSSLAFRIEAIKFSNEGEEESKILNADKLKKMKSESDIEELMRRFLVGITNSKINLRENLLNRLIHIRDLLEESYFFQTHEVIGSSLLLIHDDEKISAWIIDFAKSFKSPVGQLNHRSNWNGSNHEDGYLTGLDNLIRVIKDLNLVE